MTPQVKSYAFYLPQFHPTAENDEWWGKGFTEWRNVAKARPRYGGHEQPRLPADLGFYDLRVPEVRVDQAALAQEHGIDGFIYYHYWFNGRRLLHRPVDDLLASNSPDFPFALCWANEDWRRNWDGFSGEMLMEQTHSREDDEEHIRWLLKAFADPRYIRFEGKPMFLVYRAARIPNVEETIALWRRRAREAGIGELHLCRVESDNDEFVRTPSDLGFDAAVEFGIEWRHLGSGRDIDGTRVYSYLNTAQRMLYRPRAEYTRHAGISTGFDNTARKPDSLIVEGATPSLYQEWLSRTVRRELVRNPDASEIPIFVNAWNEWAEGAILEPCAHWGKAFLVAHRDGIAQGIAVEESIGSALEEASYPSLTVGLVTTGNAEATMAALTSALEATRDERLVEFVVVDNGSVDETASLLRELGSAITLITNATAVTFEMAWNQAIARASSRYVLALSSDVRLDPGAVAGARQSLASRSDASGVAMSLEDRRRTVRSQGFDCEFGVLLLVEVPRLRQQFAQVKFVEGKRPAGRLEARQPLTTS